jgi:hypothetical protein
MLWQFFPTESLLGLEEGLTETISEARGPETFWREPVESFGGMWVRRVAL